VMKKCAVMLIFILCGCQSEDAQLAPDDHVCRPHRFPIVQAYCGGASERGGPCRGVPKAFAAACADGCFLQTCGPAVACKENAAICEGSCDNPESAMFWRDLMKAETACHPDDRFLEPAPRSCVIQEAEKRCPKLAGTRHWHEHISEMQKSYP